MEVLILRFENGEKEKGGKDLQISSGEPPCQGEMSGGRLQLGDKGELDGRTQAETRETIQKRLKWEVYFIKKYRNCHQSTVIVTTDLKLTVIVTTSTVIVTII